MESSQLFFTGLGAFTGVFLGVVAGTLVTILTHLWLQRRHEFNQIRNLVFELELNCKKLEGWLEELGRYRNAVNGDSLLRYYGYYKISSGVGVTAHQLHESGLLYKYLSHEHIGQLQEVFTDLSLPGENYMNNQIQQRKQSLQALEQLGQQGQWMLSLKPQVVNDIDFWEGKLRGHENALRSIIGALHIRQLRRVQRSSRR
jgi:hypothetical protein